MVYHPQASSFNAARTEIKLHEMRVRTIHENQMRIERKRERASSYGSHYDSNVGLILYSSYTHKGLFLLLPIM